MLRLNSASAMINENLGWVTQCLQSYKDTAMTAKLFDWIAERKWDDIDAEKGPSFLGAHAGTFPTSPSTPSFVCCMSETGLGNRGCYVEVRLWHVITQCFLCRNCQQLSGLISCAGEMQPITFEWFNVLRMNISFIFSLRRLYVRQFNAMLPPKLYSCDCALSVRVAPKNGGWWEEGGRGEREREPRGAGESVYCACIRVENGRHLLRSQSDPQ
jgi:hypothetical protein